MNGVNRTGANDTGRWSSPAGRCVGADQDMLAVLDHDERRYTRNGNIFRLIPQKLA